MQRIMIAVMVAGALLGPAATPAAVSPPPPPGEVTFRGDFETGDLSQFAGRPPQCFTQNDSTCEVVGRGARQGMYAGRFTTNATDDPPTTQRAMVFGYPPGEQDGGESYYAFAVMFPTGFVTPSWLDFLEFDIRDHGILGCNMVEFFASYDDAPPAHQVFVRVCAGLTSDVHERTFNVQDGLNVGQWNEYVLHVKWRHDATGLLEVWHRVQGGAFAKVVTYEGPTDYFDSSWTQPEVVGFEYGMYRSGDTGGPQSVYHDGLVRGTSLDAVVRAAFGP
jgi:hypothetical protein